MPRRSLFADALDIAVDGETQGALGLCRYPPRRQRAGHAALSCLSAPALARLEIRDPVSPPI